MVLRTLYMLPLLLGRTFDVNNNKVGVDIFPAEDTANPRIISETWFGSNYKTIDTSADIKEVLGVRGDLSLKIKADMISVQGGGSYFRENLKLENSIDVLIRVTFRTFSKSLPSSAKPIANWLRINPKFLGTHFVKSIIYGGDLVACVSFKVMKGADVRKIKGIVKAALETGSALSLVADGSLDILQTKLKGEANVEVSYYATVPIETVPQSLDGLRLLVANFKEQVEKVNDGWGVPMEVELQDLSTIGSKKEFLKDSALETELNIFEEQLDDLISAKSKIKTWLATTPAYLNKEDEKRIDDLYSRISGTLHAFFDVIANLDLTKGPGQLQPATDTYMKNGKSRLVGKFGRELNKIFSTLVLELEEVPKKGSAIYTHYGRTQCNGNQATTILSGFMASSPSHTMGNGHNYLCLPQNPEWNEKSQISNPGSTLSGMKYGLLSNSPFLNRTRLTFRSAACSICSALERSSIMTFYGTENCPENGDWTKEYDGYLMTSADVTRGEYICMDNAPEFNDGNEELRHDQSLVMVRANFDEEDENFEFVQCTICSKK